MWETLNTLASRLSSVDAVLLGVAYLLFRMVTAEAAIKRATVDNATWVMAGIAGGAVVLRILIILVDAGVFK